MRALAIVPAYNEERSVGSVVRELLSRGDLDVVVVDDGSTDGTAAAALAAGARVVRLRYNVGIGGAVQCGLMLARREAYDIAVQVDGDGQHLPSEIGRLLAPLLRGEAELVLGSRYVDKTCYRTPWARRAGMKLFAFVVSAVTGRRFFDTTSGFRACDASVIEYLSEHYPEDYPEVEALVLLSRAGFRILEVSCEFGSRTGGHSSITPFRSAYYMVKVLLAIAIGLFREVPPRADQPGEAPG